MLRNSDNAWGSGAKWLHWILVLMIAVEIPVGFLMTATYGLSLQHADVVPIHDVLSQIHHTNGFFHIDSVWCPGYGGACAIPHRRCLKAPVPPAGGSPASIRASCTRCCCLSPLSGWAAMSVLADSAQFGETHIWFFASDDIVPAILPALSFNDPLGYGLYARIHRYLLIGGGFLLGLHVLAALWHHLRLKDGVLLRMWPAGAATGAGDRSAPAEHD